ncbi:hypothetical protein EJP617_C010 (plasmid) [Erwinia sp. Ejp617]|nr:hypothetical protein EJP617_C010 [Erwinia sp. Ejp617]
MCRLTQAIRRIDSPTLLKTPSRSCCCMMIPDVKHWVRWMSLPCRWRKVCRGAGRNITRCVVIPHLLRITWPISSIPPVRPASQKG